MKDRTERLSGRVRSLAHGGEAVVETSGGVVLVRGGLPGEEIRIEAGQKHNGVRRGRLLKLIGPPSPDRVEPPCTIVSQCGGCPLMGWSRSAQHEHKRLMVAHAIDGIQVLTGVAVTFDAVAGDLGYRRRARLAWGRDQGKVVVGYRTGGSKRVIAVDRCVVLTPSLSLVLPQLVSLLPPALIGEGEIELTPARGGATCVSLTTASMQPQAVYLACGELATRDGVAGVALRAGGIDAAATWGSLEQEVVASDGLPLIGPAEGFSQANESINARLVELVVELAEPQGAEILELYAGQGNLTVALAPKAAHVSAVELDRELVKACQANLTARGISNVKVRADAAEVGAKGTAVDCVVLDPPRTGAKDAIDGIVARKPKRIVYVSCDPVTLRRDAQLLAAAGYRVDRAHALDMFPHTAHVEAVVRFMRL